MKQLSPLPYNETFPTTPAYVYSEKNLTELWEAFSSPIASRGDKIAMHFSMKANSNPHILKFFIERGAGIDVVSGGELSFALECGAQADKIIFSGVGKRDDELRLAVKQKIEMINVESFGELKRLARIAEEEKTTARVAVRFNPDISVETHPYIATGLWEHKFGLDRFEAIKMYEFIKEQEFLHARGLSIHIGSQLFDLKVMEEAFVYCIDLGRELKNKGIALQLMNIGGGLGVYYDQPLRFPEFQAYADLLQRTWEKWADLQDNPEAKVLSECGRSMCAQAGYLITRVIGTKSTEKKNFAIVDASITELIRPALYQAVHPIDVWGAPSKSCGERKVYDIVGPVCESSDILGAERELPLLQEGDALLISCAGAYGYTMANFYNFRSLPAEYWLTHEGELLKSREAILPPRG